MAGSKKNKIKKVFAPSSSSNAPPSSSKDINPDVDDSDSLLDDLLAQIDSKQQHTDIEEAATVLRQIENTALAQDQPQQRKSNRNRFEARQVRILIMMAYMML